MGQVIFMRAHIAADDGRELPILTMGPICISPAYKRQGYGKLLLDYALDKAIRLGAGAVCFEGNIDFYRHYGLTYAADFGIRYHGLSEGADVSFSCAASGSRGISTGSPGSTPRPPDTSWTMRRWSG